MADTKISSLSAVTDVQTTDEFVLARAGTTKKITGANLSSEVGGSGGYVLEPASEPPGSANALDDEFDDTSLDGKWSWLNQGAATWTEANGRGLLYVPKASNNSQWHGIEQTVAGSFDIRTKITRNVPMQNYYEFSLFGRNSTSGKIIQCEFIHQSSGMSYCVKSRWNSASSYNASSGPHNVGGSILWLRMTNDGTTLWLYYSHNGLDWIVLDSEALSTFVISVNRVGVACQASNTSWDDQTTVHFFRNV